MWVLIAISISMGCKENLFEEGERIYTAYCSNCHMDNGSGLGTLIPPLTSQEYLTVNKTLLPCIITYGQQGPIEVDGIIYNWDMPGAELSDVQLLNLINYITNEWGNNMGYTTIDEIKLWKSKCEE